MNLRWNSPILFAFAISLVTFSKSFSSPDSLLHELSKPFHDSIKFDILISIGDYYEYNQPDSAIFFYKEAERVSDKLIVQKDGERFVHLKTKALRYVGYVYLNQGDYKTATEEYFKALTIAESVNDSLTIYNCYNNIGIINHLQKEYDVAKDYYSKALEITVLIGNEFGKSKLYINLGNLYFDLGDNTDSIPQRKELYKLAQENYKNALDIKRKVNDNKGQSLCCNNLGNLKKKSIRITDDSKIQRSLFEEAAGYYQQSITISEKINDLSGLSMVYANLSDLFSTSYELLNLSNADKKSRLDSALFYAEKAYNLALSLNSVYLQNEISELLKKTYTLSGNPAKALEFANIYIETSRNLFNEEKTKVLKEMLTKYETEKKEKEIQQQQLKLQKANFRLMLVLSIAGFFVIAISFLAYILRLRYQTEKVLETKNKQLHESNATKDKFFSIISHDLRSPVSGFRNLSALIGQNFERLSTDQIKEYVIDLSKSADETVSLLNNLLQWSKSQQNKIEVKKFQASINRLLSKISEEFATKLKEKNLVLKTEIVDNDNVEIDENIVSTIIRNLISNAIKFSPPNSTIELFSSISNENYRISVKDQGIGMTNEDCNKLFRIECDTKSIGNSPEKGSGLGLILCKELVNLHGGTIWVESVLGKGSIFSFTIPLENSYGKV